MKLIVDKQVPSSVNCGAKTRRHSDFSPKHEVSIGRKKMKKVVFKNVELVEKQMKAAGIGALMHDRFNSLPWNYCFLHG